MDLEKAADDFKTASDELRRPVTYLEIANQCGVSVESIQRAVLWEGSDAYLPPPRFWKGDLAYLARERAAELVVLADELEASAWAPATEEELEEIGSMILTQIDEVLQPTAGSVDIQLRREDTERLLADTERRLADTEKRRADMEKRRADREERREVELAELNAMFQRGLRKDA